MNRVVFFGNEKLATGIDSPQPLIRNALEEAGFEIEQTITKSLSSLQAHEAQIAVLAAYGKIIPRKILDEFPLGIINVHPSLLPQHRGPTPIEQTILDGETKTGVSIMRLSEKMDEGPIYKQKTLRIDGNETKENLALQLHKLGAELISEILPSIASGALPPRQQPHPDRATYSQKITKEHGQIDWRKPAINLEREIRAFSGWPRSYTTLGNTDVIIKKAHVIEATNATTPGEIIIGKDYLHIGTTEHLLGIDSIQPLGKKEMPILAFLSGYRNKLSN